MRSLPYPFISYLIEMWAPPLDQPPARLMTASMVQQPVVEAAAPFRLPRVASTTAMGNVTDTLLNRDSCNSARVGRRTLWTCRDTQWIMPNGLPQLAIFSSTASWSDDADPLRMYGDQDGRAFFPLLDGNCNNSQAGMCGDGTRFSIWPDSPPVVAEDDASENIDGDGTVAAYTWIKRFRVDDSLKAVEPDPATTLYRIEHREAGGGGGGGDGNGNGKTINAATLPTVSVVNASFYPAGAVAYGNYGSVTRDGWTYLYGQLSDGRTAVARTRPRRAALEDQTTYEYFAFGAWTRAQPSADAVRRSCCDLPNASAGGQGTYYYSERWGRYVWVGQSGFSVSADFYITTAPRPEGPWDPPALFYRGVGGNYSLSAYSLQAHPSLVGSVQGPGEEMVISWTKNDVVIVGPGAFLNVYTTPLVRVRWE